MKPTQDDLAPQSKDSAVPAPRQWKRPRLVAYGPISKLTRGNSGGTKDGTLGKKAP